MNVFSIPLNEGKITGKSKLNFTMFTELLDSNVKFKFTITLLRSVGIKPSVNKDGIVEFLVSSPPIFDNFKRWLIERQNYIREKDKRNNLVTPAKLELTAEEV